MAQVWMRCATINSKCSRCWRSTESNSTIDSLIVRWLRTKVKEFCRLVVVADTVAAASAASVLQKNGLPWVGSKLAIFFILSLDSSVDGWVCNRKETRKQIALWRDVTISQPPTHTHIIAHTAKMCWPWAMLAGRYEPWFRQWFAQETRLTLIGSSRTRTGAYKRRRHCRCVFTDD